jgi:hypothetical protein
MKGTLHKTEQGWVVNSFYESPSSLPLHPEFIEMMDYAGKQTKYHKHPQFRQMVAARKEELA